MPRPWKIILAALLAIVGTLGYLIAQLVLPGPKIVVSKETTYVTAPLAPDGLPDYAGYLRGKLKEGVTSQNNAAIPLLRVMWPPGDVELEDQPVFCKEIGMEIPEPNEPLPFGWARKLSDELSGWLRRGLTESEEMWEEDPRYWGSEYLSWAEDQPWSAEELPLLAAWVEDQSPRYDLLHEAARREKCYCPALYLPGRTHLDLKCLTHSPLGAELIAATRLLGMRANLRLGHGEVAGAWEDCRAMYRLSEHVPQDFDHLTSMVMESPANRVAVEILSSPDLDADTAREMHEFFQMRGLRHDVVARVDQGQRLVILCYAISLSGQGGEDRRIEDDEEGDKLQRWLRTLDWNEVLRVINAEYDLAVEGADQLDRDVGIDQLFGGTGPAGRPPGARMHPSRRERTNYFLANHLDLMLGTLGMQMGMEDRTNSRRQLVSSAAALAVHRLEQGEYPESLGALVPELLEAVPVDVYRGQPLVYRRTEGGYLLYSRGPNGVDDGGSNNSLEITEGYDAELSDFAATRENLNAVRELLGWPLLTEEQFAKRKEAEAESVETPVFVAGAWEDEGNPDDLSIRLPLPRLKLPLPGSPPPRD